MKPSANVKLQEGLYSKEFCDFIVDYLNELPDTYWYHRTKIGSIPTKGTKSCDYYIMTGNQMPEELRNFLKDIAPRVNDEKPVEVIINKYKPGGFMSEHIDLSPVIANMVIQLNAQGDGVTIEGVMHEDSYGGMVMFPTSSPPHEVPPVKHLRYVFICHYE